MMHQQKQQKILGRLNKEDTRELATLILLTKFLTPSEYNLELKLDATPVVRFGMQV